MGDRSTRVVETKSTGSGDRMGLLDVGERKVKVDTLISTEMRADLKVGRI